MKGLNGKRRLRGAIAILLGVVMGLGMVITPAAAAKFLTKKAGDKRYLRKTATAGGDITGTFSNLQIGANAVGANEIAANAVTTAKIADNAVTSAKIADGAVGTADIADNAITLAKMADNSVASAEVVDNSLTGADINESTLGQVPQAANADTLDGYHANELSRLGSAVIDFPALTSGTDHPIASVQITLAKQSIVRSTASFYTFFSGGAASGCLERFLQRIDGGAQQTGSWSAVSTPVSPTSIQLDNVTSQGVFVAGPGTHTIELIYNEELGTCRSAATFFVGRGHFVAEMVPFSANGTPARPNAVASAPTNGSDSTARP